MSATGRRCACGWVCLLRNNVHLTPFALILDHLHDFQLEAVVEFSACVAHKKFLDRCIFHLSGYAGKLNHHRNAKEVQQKAGIVLFSVSNQHFHLREQGMVFEKGIKFAIAAGALSLVTACSHNVPACSDQESTELVKQIAKDAIAEEVGRSMADQTLLSVEAIRTTDENEKTGALECAAELIILPQRNVFPITYTVEATDDNGFYVTVYGI